MTSALMAALTSVNVPKALAAGAYHSLFLNKNGEVWAWGQNTSDQIGIGITSAAEPIPSEVPGLPTVRPMAADVNHALALDEAGKVWGWA
ncbi:hypothetical protein [Corallococcus llansteffanensis]|uniref:RCC1 repeat-containing protein n=1 Tax=Corallococcus llansteffanensis TaxID=2316731 RepID=A0A3A8QEC5_9BACT|nr:hypothetical protein [Corallococcus llansteffanensis]RKH67043.1 hypothetical protein D7V93_03475 [Corallococcus llansteffanensis]